MMDRFSDVTYELLSEDGSTFHIHRNHLIPHYPNEPLLYSHLRNFEQFSLSIITDIPKPIKYANKYLSSFLSDTSSFDDTSYNTNHPFNLDTSLNDTSSYNTINKTRDTNPSYTRIRQPTDSSSLPPPNDRSQNRSPKPHYKLGQQPRKGYRILLSPSKILSH